MPDKSLQNAAPTRASSRRKENAKNSTVVELEVLSEMPNWSVLHYCARNVHVFDVGRFNEVFLDDWKATMFNRAGVHWDTDIGWRNRRWCTLSSCCAGTIWPVEPFDMPFVRHADEDKYLRKLQTLMGDVLGYVDAGSRDICCLQKPYDKFCPFKDADVLWSEFVFERRQSTNVLGRRYRGRQNLKVSALPQREHDFLQAGVPETWGRFECFWALGVSLSDVHLYMRGVIKDGSVQELSLVGRSVEIEFVLLSLEAFLRTLRYGRFERLSYNFMFYPC